MSRRGYALGLLTDQAINSLTNFAVVALIARHLGTGQFSQFAVVQVIVLLVQIALQSGLSDGYLREAGAEPRRALRLGARVAAERIVLVGAALSLIGLGTGGELPRLATGALFTVCTLAANDFARSSLIADRYVARAIGLDVAFGTVQIVIFVVLPRFVVLTPATVWWWWGLSAVPTAALFWLFDRTRVPGTGRIRPTFRPRYSIEMMLTFGASQVAQLVATPVLGFLFVGRYRSGQLLFGPITVLFSGSRNLLLLLYRTKSKGRRARLLAMVLLAVAAAVWSLVLGVLPIGVLRQLLGPTGDLARSLLLPLTVSYMAQGAYLAAFYYARSRSYDRATTRSRVVQLFVLVVTTAAAMAARSQSGFVYGTAAAAAAGVVVLLVGKSNSAPATDELVAEPELAARGTSSWTRLRSAFGARSAP